jgi:tetratricopeptide (TPR) repeat protein
LRAAQDRHAAWFAARGPQRAVLGACADLDNLVVACRRATAAGAGEVAAGALEGAWAALSLRGPFSSAVALGEAVLQVPQLGAAAGVRAQLALAAALESLGRRAPATALYETALRVARSQNDLRPQVQACIRLARLRARTGLPEQALQELGEALRWARSLADRDLCASALNIMGAVTFECGHLDEASGHFQAALDEARAVGDLRLQGSVLGNLSAVHAEQQRLERAQAFGEEALAISRQLGDLPRVGERLSGLGKMCHLRGDHGAALALSLSALGLAKELGHVRLECATLVNLGTIQIALDHPAGALEHLEAALVLAELLDDGHLARELKQQIAELAPPRAG